MGVFVSTFQGQYQYLHPQTVHPLTFPPTPYTYMQVPFGL